VIIPILHYPDDILVQKAEAVANVDDALREFVDNMVDTMYEAPGIGLAAPQVGVLKRITVIDVSTPEEEPDLHVLINPEIIARSDELIAWEEGCLSIPGVFAKLKYRAAEITVRAINRDGDPYEFNADGLLSVCVQHELDHLDGVLFIDHLSNWRRQRLLKRYRKLQQEAVTETTEG